MMFIMDLLQGKLSVWAFLVLLIQELMKAQ